MLLYNGTSQILEIQDLSMYKTVLHHDINMINPIIGVLNVYEDTEWIGMHLFTYQKAKPINISTFNNAVTKL